MGETRPLELGDFPAASLQDWRRKVEEDLGENAFERLSSREADGLVRRPLYTAQDAPEGRVAAATTRGWKIAQEIDLADAQAEETARAAAALGVDLLWLHGDAARFAAPEGVEVFAASQTEGLISLVDDHEAGAGPVDEAAFLLGALADLRRAGVAATDVDVAIDSDVFAEIAKLRAFRLLAVKFLAACGVSEKPPRFHGRTSQRTRSRVDPWGNLLRVGAQGFAAVVGGVDSLRVAANEEAVGIEGGLSAELAQRVAVNAQHVLAEEAHLARVVDPSGGSYYLETLTEQIARDAWELFREIERGGGLAARRAEGWVAERLAQTAENRLRAVAKRREVLVGVNDFARLDDEIADDLGTDADEAARLRLALPFERLRARAAASGQRPSALLLRFGSAKDARARADYAGRFLAAGGIEVRDGGFFASAEEVGAAVQAGAEKIVVLCAADADYPQFAPDALRDAGERRVVVAGRPGEHEEALREAGVRLFIHLGCDAVAALDSLL